jgi:hypothetical protein
MKDRLDRLIDGVIRELPLRRAPPTLESRVLDELARREAAPWVQRSFSHWPMLARAAFVAGCTALAAMVVIGASRFTDLFRPLSSSGPPLWWLHANALANAAGTLAASLADGLRISSAPLATWLELTLTAAALLYACLFGLGAAAYRLLYLHPQRR